MIIEIDPNSIFKDNNKIRFFWKILDFMNKKKKNSDEFAKIL